LNDTAWRTAWLGRTRQQVRALLFVLPTLFLLGVFVYLPLARAIRYSFTQWDGLSPPREVGFANYSYLWHFDDFHRVVQNTAILVLGIALWVALPFVIALVIHGMRHEGLVRLVLFVPGLLPAVVIGGVFRLILANDGPLNSAFRSVGLGFLAVGWLSDPRWVLWTVILTIAWAVLGSGVLFYSAGLTSVPTSQVEAARMDGASWAQLAWFVYRPALRPVTRFWTLALTVSTVTGFFPWIYSLTHGGPGISSTTIDYQVWQTGIVNGQYGLASAMSVVVLAFVMLLLAVQLVGRRVRRVDG
jgi:ABC-type sugar transport system permease subunit